MRELSRKELEESKQSSVGGVRSDGLQQRQKAKQNGDAQKTQNGASNKR